MPTVNERFPIAVEVKAGSEATLRIYDLEGREIDLLFDGVLTTGTGEYTWDGRDGQLFLVPAGTYICHLEVRDREGNVSNHRAPIVVARRLERN
jgi:hypothetical protein